MNDQETNTKSATNNVYGVIAHVPIPFHLPNDNGCQMGLNCPIQSGDLLSESVTLPIKSEYPQVCESLLNLAS